MIAKNCVPALFVYVLITVCTLMNASPSMAQGPGGCDITTSTQQTFYLPQEICDPQFARANGACKRYASSFGPDWDWYAYFISQYMTFTTCQCQWNPYTSPSHQYSIDCGDYGFCTETFSHGGFGKKVYIDQLIYCPNEAYPQKFLNEMHDFCNGNSVNYYEITYYCDCPSSTDPTLNSCQFVARLPL